MEIDKAPVWQRILLLLAVVMVTWTMITLMFIGLVWVWTR